MSKDKVFFCSAEGSLINKERCEDQQYDTFCGPCPRNTERRDESKYQQRKRAERWKLWRGDGA